MQGVQPEANTEYRSSLQTMSVNIRLCGSIPRKDMRDITGGAGTSNSFGSRSGTMMPCSLKACLTSSATSSLWGNSGGVGGGDDDDERRTAVCDALNGLVVQGNSGNSLRAILTEDSKHQQQQQQQPPLGPILEPPSWAVPAKGETRLEPVCEAVGRHSQVDLTTRACYRIGRSPNSDVQLLHGTSSRRHAMLFHHSNGSCYVVDCGSAHGTYVNGARVPSPSNGGLVIPHRVKRGALIRFGGPGAPCFLLKSFHFTADDVLNGTVVEAAASSPDAAAPNTASTSPDMGELVRRNTRLNALGMYNRRRGSSISSGCRDSVCSTIEQALYVTRKRSFDSFSDETLPPASSMDEDDDASMEQQPEINNGSSKRMRCSSPPLVAQSPLRLVSPELPASASRPRVTFSTEPPQLCFPVVITPAESCDEGDHHDE